MTDHRQLAEKIEHEVADYDPPGKTQHITEVRQGRIAAVLEKEGVMSVYDSSRTTEEETLRQQVERLKARDKNAYEVLAMNTERMKSMKDQVERLTVKLAAQDLAYHQAEDQWREEIERLTAGSEALQPQHHYMTKMEVELHEEVDRLHEENKRLTADLARLERIDRATAEALAHLRKESKSNE